MARAPKSPAAPRPIETLVHADSAATSRPPSSSRIAQQMEEVKPFEPARYQRATPLAKGETRERNADLDPQIVWRGMRITLSQAQRKQLQETGEVELGDAQLVWRGKDTQDWSDLVVNPPPIYIQEKVHPKAIIDGYAKDAARAGRGDDGCARSVRRLQRAGRSGSAAGILPARPALVEPHDPRRQPAGDGEPRRARGAARQGAVHLFRPALRHQVQLQLAGLARRAAT